MTEARVEEDMANMRGQDEAGCSVYHCMGVNVEVNRNQKG